MDATTDGDGAAEAAEAELRALWDRARSGDGGALPGIRAALDDRPGLWRAYGDVAAHARAAWVALVAGHDVALGESLRRKADELAAELAGPGAPPLERLLAERVVACWLQAHHADAMMAQSAIAPLKQAAFALRRQDAAHRRYLQAIGALATARRLLPAAIDVGVGPGLMAPGPRPGPAGVGDAAPPAGVPDAAGAGAAGAAAGGRAEVIAFEPPPRPGRRRKGAGEPAHPPGS